MIIVIAHTSGYVPELDITLAETGLYFIDLSGYGLDVDMVIDYIDSGE
jgi:hypothetical protein